MYVCVCIYVHIIWLCVCVCVHVCAAMLKSCCAVGCANRYFKGCELKFYHFPTDQQILSKEWDGWLLLFERTGFLQSTAGFVVPISSEELRAMTPRVRTMCLWCLAMSTLLKRRESSSLCSDIKLERQLKETHWRQEEGRVRRLQKADKQHIDSKAATLLAVSVMTGMSMGYIS